ncbi:hypothetical protein ACSSS7_005014 [Eimeria intestinalis]
MVLGPLGSNRPSHHSCGVCAAVKMFRRPLGAGNQSALGNKDKKRLREQLLRSFPLLSEDDLEQLLPAKEPMSVVRLNLPQASQAAAGPQQPEALPPLMSASSANKCALYMLDEAAVVAEVNGLLFPTLAMDLLRLYLFALFEYSAYISRAQVHGLWRAPKMLPCILIFSPVSAFVMKGADLMLPGVCRPLTAAAAAATASAAAAAGAAAAAAAAGGGIAPGQLWAVRVVGNALPFAVGRAVTRAPSLELLGDKGRALELIHHLGDALWKHGKEVSLPPLFSYKQVYSGSDDAELLAACGMGPPESLPGSLQQGDCQGRQQQEEEGEEVLPSDAAEDAAATPAAAASAAAADGEGELQQQGDTAEAASGDERSQGEASGTALPSMTPEEVDAYLELCLLETLHTVSDEQLPLDISALYSKLTAEAPAIYYTRIARGDAPFIAPDIRRSSAKKLGKFAQTASKKKLLQTKEQRGLVSVVKINRSHPEYVKHVTVPESQKRKLIEKAAAAAGAAAQQAGPAVEEGGPPREAPSAAAGGRSTSGPLVFEFCVPASKCSRIFAAAGVRSGKNVYFTSQEYREVLEKYLEVRESKREDANQPGEGAPQRPTSSRPARSSAVMMDPLLAEAVLTKEERGDAKAAGSEPQIMEKAELFQRWQETQQPCHAVLRSNDELPLLQDRIVYWQQQRRQQQQPPTAGAAAATHSRSNSSSDSRSNLASLSGGEHLIRDLIFVSGVCSKGACSPIRITVEDKFGGRKHATHILNAANFLLDPKTVADFLQKKLAASASLYAPPGAKATSAVCVQGNVAGPVAELLISHFGIPKKYIEVEIKKPKSGR